MLIVDKNTQFNFKTNDEWLKKAKEVFASKGLDATSVFNQLIYEVMTTGEIPFQTQDEKEREEFIHSLGKEIDNNLALLRSGKGMSIAEARRRLKA